MTPHAAAALLGVSEGASRLDIERAYRQQARVSHPDRFAGASEGDVAKANERFALLTQAREVLLAHAGDEQPVPLWQPERRVEIVDARRGWKLTAGWTGVLLFAVFLSLLAETDFFAPVDQVLRIVLLAAFSISAALTGSRFYEIGAIVLLALSALATLFSPYFGSLVALPFLVVSVLGLLSVGRARRPRSG